MAERVKGGHSCQKEEGDLHQGQEDINHPEHASGLLDPGLDGFLIRAGNLRPVQLPSRHSQAGQYGHEEQYYPHPSQPLGK